ncbi:MAG: transcriptional repressor [Pseudomonadales bacterium]|nr:transcriptional repressor [Pseudomonadales bacterium]
MQNQKSLSDTVVFGNKHNHALCIEEALNQAKRVCEKGGERFTDLRRQVFELVWAEHKPVKAYDLLSELASKRSGVAPATVYRTLDFLQAQGLVHKLESLNAYMGCSHPEQEHQGQFLICESCEEVRELEFAAFNKSIDEVEKEQHFQIKHMTVELFGVCGKCQNLEAEQV